MKTRTFLGAVLLGLAFSSPAFAQVMPSTNGVPGGAPGAAGTVVATPPASATTPATGTAAPGQAELILDTVPPGAVPANATTPTSVSGSGALYPNGVPARNLDGGTLRADQPVGSGRPAVPGSQPTRRLNKGRTTTAPVRP